MENYTGSSIARPPPDDNENDHDDDHHDHETKISFESMATFPQLFSPCGINTNDIKNPIYSCFSASDLANWSVNLGAWNSNYASRSKEENSTKVKPEFKYLSSLNLQMWNSNYASRSGVDKTTEARPQCFNNSPLKSWKFRIRFLGILMLDLSIMMFYFCWGVMLKQSGLSNIPVFISRPPCVKLEYP